MKRSRYLLSTFTAATLATLVISGCEKKAPDQPKPPQAGDAKPVAEAIKSGDPAKVAEAVKAAALPAAEVSKLVGTYGFVARLPKDVEGFGSSYHSHELWTGLANSKWAATLLELPPVKANPEITSFRAQWNSEQGQQIRTIAEGLFGQEVTVAMPAGFTTKLQPWVKVLGIYQQKVLEAYFMMGMAGGTPSPDKIQQVIKDAAPDLIPALTECEVPPLLFALKASKVRQVVDGAMKQLMEKVGSELPPGFEPGQFKLSDKYDFQSITVNVKKLVAQAQEAQLQAQLKELLGDEAKAKAALDAIVSKRVEVAWGWVDEYLLISVGTNHDHLKLAPSDGESALGIADVAKRAAQFAAQRPHGLSYISKAVFDGVAGKIEFADQFKAFAMELQGILKPEHIEAMVVDARRIEAKAQALFTTTYDAQVQVDVWEGGFRSELFGGAKQKAFDSSKPLTFGSLATTSTFALLNGRGHAAYSKATADLIEDVAATLWSWYEKYGRTMVPESERQGAQMAEAMAKPMIVDFWKSTRKLGEGLGDESALILDLAGPMPKIPDLPPALAEGKVPRLALVSQLKDRAAVSEAWKGYYGLIKQVAALAGQGQGLPEPQMKQEGDAELHFVPLPMPTDDFLPHVAITKDRWVISTAPSFTKELVSKPATPGAQPMGNHWNVNFGALFDLADGWLKLLDKNGAQLFSPTDAKQYEEARPLFDAALKLGRSVQGFEWHLHEEAGLPRNSFRLKLQDIP
jgi:hypothetical protein